MSAPLPTPVAAEPDRVNVYTCQRCRRQLVTIDRHVGVTPFMEICDPERTPGGCGGTMYSAFYPKDRPIPARIGPPTHEWYLPSESERARLEAIPGMIEHVMQGGLDIRPIARSQQ